MITLRMATPQDADVCLALYAPYVENTTVSFEYAVPTPEEFRARIAEKNTVYPWLICEREGRVVGYAYAAPYALRPAYAWSAELSIYLEQGSRGGGLGSLLYGALIELLRAQGFYTLYAIITYPNDPSVRFHANMGFSHVGRCRQVGYKQGKWLDVDYYELPLRPRSGAPDPVTPVAELEQDVIEHILTRYSR